MNVQKKMKKILIPVFALSLLLTLTACGKKTEAAKATPAPSAPAAQPTATPAATATLVPSATPAPTATPELVTDPTPELVYVEDGVVVNEALAEGKIKGETEKNTFVGTLNTIGSNSITVSDAAVSAVFNLVEGTIMPATLTPGDEICVVYTGNASGGSDAVEITIAAEKTVPVQGTVIGCVTECDNNHVVLFVDGKLYNFTIDENTKVNLSYFDVNDYLKITYEGVLTPNMRAVQIDDLQSSAPTYPTAVYPAGGGTQYPVVTYYPVVTAYPVVTYAPQPYKPVENPMKTGSAKVVSVGDGVMVVRISGSGNDSWMTVSDTAIPDGLTVNPGDNVKIEYNSGTDTITQIRK